ncbi:phosphate ABC transporter permease PstA [Thermoactinomyces sp. DSM 45892]|uniref:phosphate ABC transporter permease PstA n=1 Tax=Thermoactinomyces sp. DSM 45892 TaxID=1882753 RepID=UPI0008968130|nr:phosphate ABC transporter membrane protein 2, PhoT family [Thermoactinomyces sp. DSM 45892]
MDQGKWRIRKTMDHFAKITFLSATLFGIAFLGILLYQIVADGVRWISWDFFTNFSSRFPSKAGVAAALIGSIWIILLTGPIAFFLGVGTALYLEEYTKKSWFTRFIQVNIHNLAGVPSIVYGILGLAVFVQGLMLGQAVLAGVFTMSLLVLPIMVVSSQEAIRSVPQQMRNASYALGASKWQTISRVVIPTALPNILTGVILALSRAIGETAPLIVVGALTFVAFVPVSPMDPFTVLPIQIFNWTSRPQDDFRAIAAAGIMVLLVVLLTMNLLAVYLRNKYQKRY